VRSRGLLLAAGAGTRYGGPKALVRDPDGTSWLLRAVHALVPCDGVTVVLGAEAEQVVRLLPPSVEVVVASDWANGMGASLRAGLAAVAESEVEADAVVVSLVDLPDVTASVVARVLAAGTGSDSLARASYNGVPGHPVLLGRDHWSGVAVEARGDRGARDYLADASVVLVECGDLATGRDVDEQG
jgi:nicotine blue oxidoreductase